jgi:uncharacterized membrane protein YkoI
MRRTLLALLLATATALPSVSVPVLAGDGRIVVAQDDDRGRGRGRGRGDERAPRLLPLGVVLAGIAQRFPGRHLDADGPFERGGRWIYRVKWLTPDGQVLIIFADAETGQILSVNGGR